MIRNDFQYLKFVQMTVRRFSSTAIMIVALVSIGCQNGRNGYDPFASNRSTIAPPSTMPNGQVPYTTNVGYPGSGQALPAGYPTQTYNPAYGGNPNGYPITTTSSVFGDPNGAANPGNGFSANNSIFSGPTQNGVNGYGSNNYAWNNSNGIFSGGTNGYPVANNFSPTNFNPTFGEHRYVGASQGFTDAMSATTISHNNSSPYSGGPSTSGKGPLGLGIWDWMTGGSRNYPQNQSYPQGQMYPQGWYQNPNGQAQYNQYAGQPTLQNQPNFSNQPTFQNQPINQPTNPAVASRTSPFNNQQPYSNFGTQPNNTAAPQIAVNNPTRTPVATNNRPTGNVFIDLDPRRNSAPVNNVSTGGGFGSNNVAGSVNSAQSSTTATVSSNGSTVRDRNRVVIEELGSLPSAGNLR